MRKLKIVILIILAITFMPVVVTYTDYGTEGPIETKYNTGIKYKKFNDLRAQVTIKTKSVMKYYGLWFYHDESVPTGMHFYVSYVGDDYNRLVVKDADITINNKTQNLNLVAFSDDIKSRGGSEASMGGVDISIPHGISKRDLRKFTVHVDGGLVDKNEEKHDLVFDKALVSWKETSVYPLFWYCYLFYFYAPAI